MLKLIIVFFCTFSLSVINTANAQAIKQQAGMLLKNGSNIRLGGVWVLNKRSLARATSNPAGVFNIAALTGDTLSFSSDNFQSKDIVVTDLADKIIYLEPAIQLDEVIVKENSLRSDIKEVMRGYREKSVFYNGTPHYYYLVLKPMTFIYENFKSEKIFARRFSKYATRELAANEVDARFNNEKIKKAVPIKDNELEDFELTYSPSVEQLRRMSDYDLINYIRNCYKDFTKNKVMRTENKL
jgi:hypothetical protein